MTLLGGRQPYHVLLVLVVVRLVEQLLVRTALVLLVLLLRLARILLELLEKPA